MTSLYERDAGRGFDVEQRQSEVDQLKAQLANAQWNLDKTVVRAPGRRLRHELGLRKGARVGNLSLSPVMAFIDTSATRVGVEIDQINARYVAAGQEVEIAFKLLPGRVFTGKVESILQAVATGQAQISGTAVMPKGIETVPLSSVSALDDAEFAKTLPAGATGAAAIFTDHVKVSHLIRRVLLRQVAILDYVNPF